MRWRKHFDEASSATSAPSFVATRGEPDPSDLLQHPLFIRTCSAATHCSQGSDEEQREQASIRSLARRHWGRTWCVMLRHNILACARDTREGLRSPPRFPKAAPLGPRPTLDVGNDGSVANGHHPADLPRVSGSDTLGTAGSRNRRQALPQGASSGRTVIQYGVSGRRTYAMPTGQLEGRDEPENEYSGEGGAAAVDGSPRKGRRIFVPEGRASTKKGIPQNRDELFISSSDISSNASTRSVLRRGPPTTTHLQEAISDVILGGGDGVGGLGPRPALGVGNDVGLGANEPDLADLPEGSRSDRQRNRRMGLPQGASSGRTVIQHGVSGRRTYAMSTDQLEGQDAPKSGASAVDGSPRLERRAFIPEGRAPTEKAIAQNRRKLFFSSRDISSKASSRGILGRGPSTTTHLEEENSGVTLNGGDLDGGWRTMGVPGFFKRRPPPTESAVPRRSAWQGSPDGNIAHLPEEQRYPKHTGVDNETCPPDPVSTYEGKTENARNQTGNRLPRMSPGVQNPAGADTRAKIAVFSGSGMCSSPSESDDPREFNVMMEAEGLEAVVNGHHEPVDAVVEHVDEVQNHNDQATFSARSQDSETRDPAAGRLPWDSAGGESEPADAVVPHGVEAQDREKQPSRFKHLRNTGAWDSAAGSAYFAPHAPAGEPKHGINSQPRQTNPTATYKVERERQQGNSAHGSPVIQERRGGDGGEVLVENVNGAQERDNMLARDSPGDWRSHRSEIGSLGAIALSIEAAPPGAGGEGSKYSNYTFEATPPARSSKESRLGWQQDGACLDGRDEARFE